MNASATALPLNDEDVALVTGSGSAGINDWLKMALESSKYVTEVPGGEAYFSIGKDSQGEPCLSVWLSTFGFDQHISVYKGQDGNPVTYVRTKTGVDSEGKLVGDTVGRYIGEAVKAHVGFRPTEARGNRKSKPQSHMFCWLRLGKYGKLVWDKFVTQDFARINHEAYGVTPETDEVREQRIAEYRARRNGDDQAQAEQAPAPEAPAPAAETTQEQVDAFTWK